jgi:ParB family transcriptional regulator, chromosome partitioning protein
MATAVEAPQTQFLNLDLEKITPSPMNPRRRVDDKGLKELAESIKTHGVQQPIVVRAADGRVKTQYEIVVGERRFRASKLAKRTHIPAIVRELSDNAALEIMVIENLQREDVHPLDEAMGYEALMKQSVVCDVCHTIGNTPASHSMDCPNRDQVRHPATAESIAAKLGKSVGYVYARLKLLALIPMARQAFEKDLITPGHAVLIARLQPRDQARALKACFNDYIDEREIKKIEDPSKLKLTDDDINDYENSGLRPEKALREWIQEFVNLRLKDVPWDLADAELLSEAGACTTCLKRSTSNPGLFSDLAVKGEDTCFDAACFQAKRSAFVKLQIKQDREKVQEKNAPQAEADAPVKEIEKPIAQPLLQLSDLTGYTKPKPDQAVYRRGQWVPAKLGSCDNVRKGIMVRGEEAGQTKYVCIGEKCKVHKHNLSGSPQSSGGREYDYEEENFQSHRKRIREDKKDRARAHLCKAIVKDVGAKMPVEILREIACEYLDQRGGVGMACWVLGEPKALDVKTLLGIIKKAEGARLNQIITAFLLTDIAVTSYNVQDGEVRESLTKLAKAIGVKNPGKILTDADQAIASTKQCRACGCTEEIPCEYYDGGKRIYCSWLKDADADLCSNPACKTHDDKVKTKKAKAGK